MKTKLAAIVTTIALMSALMCSGYATAVSQQYLKLDSALINEQRIEYWLKKRNQLDDDATTQQVNAAVTRYIDAYRSTLNRSLSVAPKALARVVGNNAHKSSRVKTRVASPLRVDANTVIDVNVLAILIDFPDLTHDNNGLSSSDTEMYYSNYSLEHYSDMLFSASGFTSPDPDDENLLSVYQYFKAESGNSFNFSGQVYGWYTAGHDAKYYGGNDATDNDAKVGALILEAVTAAVASGQVNLVDFDRQDPDDKNGNGNLQEPDGEIDHLVIFHSSIGEEAGGGVLATDAIWSHRFYVPNAPRAVAGSNVRVSGYTIQPIDSAAGVVSHEFAHDLGLPDEYDTNSSIVGATVANWSVMAHGSWLGAIAGTEPNSFSPYARDFLQTTYGGHWVNQLTLDAKDLDQAGREIELVEGVNHQGSINQVKIKLPPDVFKQPFSGRYQYYSTHNDQTTTKLSFSVDLPSDNSLTLSMQAQWDIELDYDYVQILANGMPLANDVTKNGMGALAGLNNLITGSSVAEQWQTLIFDLSAYAGERVNVEITYVTDPAVGGFGLVIDDLKIATASATVFFNDAESTPLTLDGFEKISGSYLLEPQYYYIQLRSHNGLDRPLADVSYSPGVVMWLADSNYDDNHVDDHPGNGFLAVIDADQQLIGHGDSLIQVRDAAFSLFNQSSYFNDNHTDNNPMFDDSLDYSSPAQPQSGVKLTPWAITMAVIAQATDSSTAKIDLRRTIHPLSAQFAATTDGLNVKFSSNSISSVAIDSYLWDFGDNSTGSILASPTHTYSQPGSYNVSLSVSDVAGDRHSLTAPIQVFTTIVPAFSISVTGLSLNLTNQSSGGEGQLSYLWDFGDGTSSTAISPDHTYSESGNYLVTLTVSDTNTTAVTVTRNINIVKPTFLPTPTPTPTPTPGKSGGSVPLIALLGGLILLVSRKVASKKAS